MTHHEGMKDMKDWEDDFLDLYHGSTAHSSAKLCDGSALV
jgi:hypothetical protein